MRLVSLRFVFFPLLFICGSERSQERGVKRPRKQLRHPMHLDLPFEVRQNDRDVPAELPNNLPASAARRGERVGVSYHGDSVEAALAFRHGLEDGHALGANSQTVSGILDVATCIDAAGFSEQSRAHAEIGVWR